MRIIALFCEIHDFFVAYEKLNVAKSHRAWAKCAYAPHKKKGGEAMSATLSTESLFQDDHLTQ